MNSVEFISWWMVAGLLLINFAIVLMAIIGAVKSGAFGFISFAKSYKIGIKQGLKDYICEFGNLVAFIVMVITLILWPLSVYQILTGKYSWN